jgi:hypothetical protein
MEPTKPWCEYCLPKYCSPPTIIEDAPLTPMEKETLVNATKPFESSLRALGVELGESPTELAGPALILRPIALYR